MYISLQSYYPCQICAYNNTTHYFFHPCSFFLCSVMCCWMFVFVWPTYALGLSTCTELTWIVNSWSIKDLYMLLERTVQNKLFIASFTLESCICFCLSCYCISRPFSPSFVFMILHTNSCVESLATLRTEEPHFSLVHLSVMVLKCSHCFKISLT